MQTLFDQLLSGGRWLRGLAEYLSGKAEAPPPGVSLSQTSLFWGVWWCVLLAIIYVFCGQSSKFIYIDF